MKDGKKCILIADDDRQICDILRIILSSEGYTVIITDNGKQAAEMASDEVDLYLLDINMPGQTGIEAAEEIRKKYETPIVFLTACSGESDKIIGFSVGADDYIVKPFSNAELLMRVRAILRRNAAFSCAVKDNCIVIGDLVLDCDRQTAVKNEEEIPLTYTEFQILKLLATNRKKIFSPDNLYESIWNDNAIGNDAIMVHIKNIRKKLGDSSRNPIYIKTAWGKGYYID